ncbi:MAG: MlrC C-terminal domain-containing protein, partial [Candidatus Bathyarchaeota archaeon]
LRELIEKNAQNAVVALIADPEAVNKAIEAGVGKTITMKIGGKTDKLHGAPLKVTGEVRIISNGKFVSKGPMGTGMEVDLGRSIVLRSGGVDIIITEKRFQPTTLELYRSFGIEPAEKKIIVVKSAVHFRASHEPIAKKIIEVDAPGIHSARLSAFRYRKLRRPIFPLDPEMLGITELKKSLED